MQKLHTSNFKEKQVTAIMKFRTDLEKRLQRQVTLSEALTSWIALGYAEEFRYGFFNDVI